MAKKEFKEEYYDSELNLSGKATNKSSQTKMIKKRAKPKNIVFMYMGATNLGIEYLSSYLKASGHRTSLVFDPALFNDKYWLEIPFLHKIFKKKDEEIISEVINFVPDFVCFSVLTDNYLWACNLAKKIKKRINVPIVFGGIHSTSVPDVVINNDFVDYVIVGEGEESLLKLADDFQLKDIPNLVYKKDNQIIKNPLAPPMDINKLPFPDKELFGEHIKSSHYNIITSRGCPFGCTYCSANYVNKLYNKKFVRRRSVENVMDELRQAKRNKKINKINFDDDVFTMNIEWFKEFMNLYKKEINLPFRCLTHPIYLTDEVGLIIKNSPCYKIEIGIQCMDENIRKKLLKRYETNEQIIKALNVCKKYKLPFHIDHMFGFTKQGDKLLKKTARLWNEYRPKRITCYWLQYFPKTEIIDLMNVSKKEVEQLERGVTSMYFVSGSVKGKKKKRMFKSYVVLFRSLQLMPKFFVTFLLNTNLYKFLAYIPDILITPIDLFVAIKAKDFKVFNYVAYYLHQFAKMQKKRVLL